MNLRRAFIAVALTAGLVASGCGSTDAVAATVNGREIDRSEFEKELKALAENKELVELSQGALAGKGDKTVNAQLAAQWLTAVIYDAVITEEFERRKLKISEADRAAAATQLTEQFNNPKVADAFPKWFKDRLSGRNARAVALRTDVTGLSGSEADLRKYYSEHAADFVQVCVSHILVKSSKEDAEAALARVRRGESFEAVAKAVSEDAGTKDKGGDLGCNFAGLFVDAFAQAAISAEIGEPTDLIQTDFGNHILLVRERPTAPFEAVRTQVKTNLTNETESEFSKFITEQAGRAKITVDERYGTFRKGPPGAPEVVAPQPPTPPQSRPGDGPAGGGEQPPGGIQLPDGVVPEEPGTETTTP